MENLLANLIVMDIVEKTGADVEDILKDFEKFSKAVNKLIDKGYTENEAIDIVTTIWEYPFIKE